MRKFIVNENDSGQRADKFIMKVSSVPKGLMYKFIRTKKIKINRRKFEISYKLQAGDVVEMYIDDEFFPPEENNLPFAAADTDIDIVYEDENIILVNKLVGMIVHSDKNNIGNTLADGIKNYLYQKGEYDPKNEASFSPSPCNRIDRNTCGIVICAKNAAALRDVNECIRLHRLHKKYICITVNAPPENQGIIKAYHFKDDKLNKVYISDAPKKDYREIATKYQIIGKKNELCVVEAELITGRSHQIRASMAHIGCAILGDTKYGVKAANDKYGIYHQALCAYSVKFEFAADSRLSYLNEREFSIDKADIWFIDKLRFAGHPAGELCVTAHDNSLQRK